MEHQITLRSIIPSGHGYLNPSVGIIHDFTLLLHNIYTFSCSTGFSHLKNCPFLTPLTNDFKKISSYKNHTGKYRRFYPCAALCFYSPHAYTRCALMQPSTNELYELRALHPYAYMCCCLKAHSFSGMSRVSSVASICSSDGSFYCMWLL